MFKIIVEKKENEKFCKECGEVIKKAAEICPKCGVRQHATPSNISTNGNKKDKVVAGILGILLGAFGAHKFYLGETGLGILYLCFFWTAIPSIIGLIEGIIYLVQTDDEFNKKYN